MYEGMGYGCVRRQVNAHSQHLSWRHLPALRHSPSGEPNPGRACDRASKAATGAGACMPFMMRKAQSVWPWLKAHPPGGARNQNSSR